MAGRPPKPTALKLVTGNPGKRALNKNEPDPTYLEDLTPPAWLSQAAREVWQEIAPKLAKVNLLTEIDVYLLAMGCTAISQYQRAVKCAGADLVKSKCDTDEDGKTVTAGEHVNPWLIVQSMAFKQSSAVFQQFGMSPAARTRIAINPQGDLFGNEKENKAFGYVR